MRRNDEGNVPDAMRAPRETDNMARQAEERGRRQPNSSRNPEY